MHTKKQICINPVKKLFFKYEIQGAKKKQKKNLNIIQ